VRRLPNDALMQVFFLLNCIGELEDEWMDARPLSAARYHEANPALSPNKRSLVDGELECGGQDAM
jgi:hypothetical protein